MLASLLRYGKPALASLNIVLYARHTYTHIQTDRQRKRQSERETHPERHRETQRDTERHTERDTERERDTRTHRHTHTDTHTQHTHMRACGRPSSKGGRLVLDNNHRLRVLAPRVSTRLRWCQAYSPVQIAVGHMTDGSCWGLVGVFWHVVCGVWSIRYNVLSGETSSELYGTEPWTFYLANGILNFNVVFVLMLASTRSITRHAHGTRSITRHAHGTRSITRHAHGTHMAHAAHTAHAACTWPTQHSTHMAHAAHAAHAACMPTRCPRAANRVRLRMAEPPLTVTTTPTTMATTWWRPRYAGRSRGCLPPVVPRGLVQAPRASLDLARHLLVPSAQGRALLLPRVRGHPSVVVPC